jgi:hypothetical protein
MARLSRRERVAATRAEETQRGLPFEHDDNKTYHYPWNDNKIFAITSQSTATTLSSTSSPCWSGFSASLLTADHSNTICETSTASPGPSWSTPDDLSDMALFTGPEHAISSQGSVLNFSELLDTSSNLSQEPPGST